MPRVLHKIKNPQEENRLINENFDRIALDIADRSGVFSTLATVSGLVVDAGGTRVINVQLVDDLNIYGVGALPVIPRVNIFINNDLDGDYLFPVGGLLTNSNLVNTNVDIWELKTVFNPIEDQKATYVVKIDNYDASPITAYVYLDSFYVPTPDLGIASRSQ